ncbi:toprim domain-containing protein [Bailinhaonella thermotolerans]|uniref:Toprim domain-containing protein n=1 Tax=Bailinhaonella thermotolerans TaxID=1070861 RepID=A0A3A4AAV6_9ACTN|nr:toprim domain-containing protein [Bailinhaonella thermotolerans]RJL23967.1 toprim domain-containing protein [Bailinhaonella thermotolerans]
MPATDLHKSGSTRRRDTPEQAHHFTQEELSQARGKIAEAFAEAGLSAGGALTCPVHGKVHRGKTLKVDPAAGTWRCYSSGEGGNAVDLLMRGCGLTFVEAVNVLLGRPAGPRTRARPATPVPDLPPVQNFTCAIDPEVYDAVRRACGQTGIQAAVRYYGAWHIAPHAVREAGATVAVNAAALQQLLVSRFGMARLKRCGLVVETGSGRDLWLLSGKYPVIEPHLTPAGRTAGMQFRPAGAQLQRVRAHERASKQARQARERGERPPADIPRYQPKFLSLAGINPAESLIGCGLPRISRLPPDSTVIVVEGFKDVLAARTMGKEAFGLPGTNAVISDRVADVLRPHRLLVALDGDEAGQDAIDQVVATLREHGVRAEPAPSAAPMDATDVLVGRHARLGCRCPACQEWLSSYEPGAA